MLILPFLVLAPMKHPAMPKVAIICGGLSIAVRLVVDFFAGRLVVAGENVPFIVLTALFVWYLLRSKRVNVTYRYRVRAAESGEPASVS